MNDRGPSDGHEDLRVRSRLSRRWLVATAIVVVAVAALAGLESIPAVPGHDQSALAAELVTSDVSGAFSKVDPFSHGGSNGPCAALESTFGVGNHLLKNRQFGFYASVWPSYQALTALYVTSLVRDSPACGTDFEQTIRAVDDNYWDPSWPDAPAYDQGPRAFHLRSDLPRIDDSLWMGLGLVQLYGRSRDPVLLDRAEQVFHLAIHNWAPGGGVYWEATGSGNRARTVVSNAPAAVLGVELFRQTGDRGYLGWSERILDWVATHLRDQASGLYDDGTEVQGGRTRVDTTSLTYDQGMVVGAIAALSEVDPARYRLTDAVGLAERSLAYFDANHSYGQPGFDLIWAENLLWTASLYRNAAFTSTATRAVRSAVAAEPKGGGDLLTSSSETALSELMVVPQSRYADLLYVIR